MFAFAPMIGTRKLTKAGMILASLFCAGVAPGSALDAQGAPQQDVSIPKLASADFGWLKPPGDEFIAPETVPGPIRADSAHPYVSNAIAPQETVKIADITNPILQPWAAEQMRKANEEVVARSEEHT